MWRLYPTRITTSFILWFTTEWREEQPRSFCSVFHEFITAEKWHISQPLADPWGLGYHAFCSILTCATLHHLTHAKLNNGLQHIFWAAYFFKFIKYSSLLYKYILRTTDKSLIQNKIITNSIWHSRGCDCRENCQKQHKWMNWQIRKWSLISWELFSDFQNGIWESTKTFPELQDSNNNDPEQIKARVRLAKVIDIYS